MSKSGEDSGDGGNREKARNDEDGVYESEWEIYGACCGDVDMLKRSGYVDGCPLEVG